MAMEPARRKHLQRMYLKLLDNIAEHHYTRIIDDLLSRDVLSPYMKNAIKSKPEHEQLRELLDILPKRGNAAFDHFYEVLVDLGEDIAADFLCPERAAERQSKHPTGPAGVQESPPVPPQLVILPENDELPAKWPDFESHEPNTVNVRKVMDSDALMKAEFQRAQSGNASVYPMYRPERGIFLLINNQFFKEARARGVELQDRDGTFYDCQGLEKLFEQLGFRVKQKLNLNAKELLEAIQDQARLDHTNYNCFACAVLTHGERDVLYGVDGEQLSIENFKDAVDGNNCPTLIGKPKLFFIQACQGTGLDTGTGFGGVGAAGPDPSKSSTEQDKVIDEVTNKFIGVNIRSEAHDAQSEARKSSKSEFYIAMATIPDFVSWRNTSFGTWFVQAIVYVFSHLAYKYTLDQLMTRVNRLVNKAETKKGLKQVSIFKSSLIGDFYFFPGLMVQMVESHSEIDMSQSAAKLAEPAQPEAAAKPAAPLQPEDASMHQQAQLQSQQPSSIGSGFTAQPSDGVDGGNSRLVE